MILSILCRLVLDEEAFSWDALKYLFHVEQIQNNVKALPRELNESYLLHGF